VTAVAERLHEELEKAGVEVLSTIATNDRA